MADVFSMNDAINLLANKFVLLIGDSNVIGHQQKCHTAGKRNVSMTYFKAQVKGAQVVEQFCALDFLVEQCSLAQKFNSVKCKGNLLPVGGTLSACIPSKDQPCRLTGDCDLHCVERAEYHSIIGF
ncbi:hypothetical protein E2C01_027326 [Portunus trituberculatus]|uniref:Uncharacterized protein n=1 Tax=Portunus trituberculatus TaxID=210409 RepID=A0A5B7EL89_PORTR|nr:hypothetical protein [Portunus trituberculatus]